MVLLDNLKLSIGERLLKREVLRTKRSTKACNISVAETIGILFDATEPATVEIVRKFVKHFDNSNKRVAVLGYVDDKKLIDHYLYRKGIVFFTKTDLNWYNKPDSKAINKFISIPFDILFNLSINEVYPLQYILALSQAKMKVGKYSPLQSYLDLMIDIEKEKEAMNGIRKEITNSAEIKKQKSIEYENIAASKASTEIQLNFLINQLMHYLSIIKN